MLVVGAGVTVVLAVREVLFRRNDRSVAGAPESSTAPRTASNARGTPDGDPGFTRR